MARATPQIHIDGDRVRVPVTSLRHSGFRNWVKSNDFPERAHATYASGQVFVEMSPEATESHNKVKSAITADLVHLVRADLLGEVYSGTLLTHVGAAVSTEPDLVDEGPRHAARPLPRRRSRRVLDHRCARRGGAFSSLVANG